MGTALAAKLEADIKRFQMRREKALECIRRLEASIQREHQQVTQAEEMEAYAAGVLAELKKAAAAAGVPYPAPVMCKHGKLAFSTAGDCGPGCPTLEEPEAANKEAISQVPAPTYGEAIKQMTETAETAKAPIICCACKRTINGNIFGIESETYCEACWESGARKTWGMAMMPKAAFKTAAPDAIQTPTSALCGIVDCGRPGNYYLEEEGLFFCRECYQAKTDRPAAVEENTPAPGEADTSAPGEQLPAIEEMAAATGQAMALTAANAVSGEDPFDEGTIWRCEYCGDIHNHADPAWRWNGRLWQHHHADAGHCDAKAFPKSQEKFQDLCISQAMAMTAANAVEASSDAQEAPFSEMLKKGVGPHVSLIDTPEGQGVIVKLPTEEEAKAKAEAEARERRNAAKRERRAKAKAEKAKAGGAPLPNAQPVP